MKHSIKRYSFDRELIAEGELEIIGFNDIYELKYKDAELEITASAPYHPLTALEKLRIQLEANHSYINCAGCRIDTALRPIGLSTYIIKMGMPATDTIGLFEPTDEIDKLCKVEEHEKNYQEWFSSLEDYGK